MPACALLSTQKKKKKKGAAGKPAALPRGATRATAGRWRAGRGWPVAGADSLGRRAFAAAAAAETRVIQGVTRSHVAAAVAAALDRRPRPLLARARHDARSTPPTARHGQLRYRQGRRSGERRPRTGEPRRDPVSSSSRAASPTPASRIPAVMGPANTRSGTSTVPVATATAAQVRASVPSAQPQPDAARAGTGRGGWAAAAVEPCARVVRASGRSSSAATRMNTTSHFRSNAVAHSCGEHHHVRFGSPSALMPCVRATPATAPRTICGRMRTRRPRRDPPDPPCGRDGRSVRPSPAACRSSRARDRHRQAPPPTAAPSAVEMAHQQIHHEPSFDADPHRPSGFAPRTPPGRRVREAYNSPVLPLGQTDADRVVRPAR